MGLNCDNTAYGYFTIALTVNGLAILEPAELPPNNRVYIGFEEENLSFECWLDLDAAEAAHPGVFVKQPLVIEVDGSFSYPDIPLASAAVGLRARPHKK